jgi:uncharacterized protein (DUF924 family)
MPVAPDILDFWFAPASSPEYGHSRAVWFKNDPEFDRLIRDRFLMVYQQAAAGQLAAWQASAPTCLALIVLLDQFSRNLFRHTPQAFATDSQALAAAERAIAHGLDVELLPVQRWFIYMPFEHSENLQHQERSVQLFEQLKDLPAGADYARRHWQVIQRFGRFPHRNAILGRPSTPEELEFLSQPGSSF